MFNSFALKILKYAAWEHLNSNFRLFIAAVWEKPARLHHNIIFLDIWQSLMDFLSLILRIVHCVCWLKDAVVNFFEFLQKALQIAKVHTDVNLKRVPTHLGIVLVEDDVSYKDVSNMILWCMLMGITYVSIYDHSGMIV